MNTNHTGFSRFKQRRNKVQTEVDDTTTSGPNGTHDNEVSSSKANESSDAATLFRVPDNDEGFEFGMPCIDIDINENVEEEEDAFSFDATYGSLDDTDFNITTTDNGTTNTNTNTNNTTGGGLSFAQRLKQRTGNTNTTTINATSEEQQKSPSPPPPATDDTTASNQPTPDETSPSLSPLTSYLQCDMNTPEQDQNPSTTKVDVTSAMVPPSTNADDDIVANTHLSPNPNESGNKNNEVEGNGKQEENGVCIHSIKTCSDKDTTNSTINATNCTKEESIDRHTTTNTNNANATDVTMKHRSYRNNTDVGALDDSVMTPPPSVHSVPTCSNEKEKNQEKEELAIHPLSIHNAAPTTKILSPIRFTSPHHNNNVNNISASNTITPNTTTPMNPSLSTVSTANNNVTTNNSSSSSNTSNNTIGFDELLTRLSMDCQDASDQCNAFDVSFLELEVLLSKYHSEALRYQGHMMDLLQDMESLQEFAEDDGSDEHHQYDNEKDNRTTCNRGNTATSISAQNSVLIKQ